MTDGWAFNEKKCIIYFTIVMSRHICISFKKEKNYMYKTVSTLIASQSLPAQAHSEYPILLILWKDHATVSLAKYVQLYSQSLPALNTMMITLYQLLQTIPICSTCTEMQNNKTGTLNGINVAVSMDRWYSIYIISFSVRLFYMYPILFNNTLFSQRTYDRHMGFQ